jgi:hypothetical protein
MIGLRCSDNGRGHTRFVEQPRHRQLGTRHTLVFGDLTDSFDNAAVSVLSLAVKQSAESVDLAPRSARFHLCHFSDNQRDVIVLF